ncbi:hypothetical protein [Polaribacter atrinae]|uniref:DUF4595 domain-containing protein n=1 Tax=Polaribacter atrinae TaxID=1333662 RepID=A0A176SZQ7_9FLAO|nr:hypothetical protein [Polaribacter atrinae]OAD40927.1 hypothetical protein LPB303_15555 [Polaribacter atrinae]
MNFRKLLLTSLICLLFANCTNNYRYCEVYQYENIDSLNQKLVKNISYNKNGQILTEESNGFKTSKYIGGSKFKNNYFYSDSLLTKVITSYPNDDSFKSINKYSKTGILLSKENYDFKQRLKKSVDKGIGRPDGCTINSDDYEKEKSWQELSNVKYLYNKDGNKIKMITKINNGIFINVYNWEYDNKNRISSHSFYEDDENLIWKDEYSYFNNGYKVINTWYNNYTRQSTHIYELDEEKRIIKETVRNEKGQLKYITITDYLNNNLVSKRIRYNKLNEPEVTHIFKYK